MNTGANSPGGAARSGRPTRHSASLSLRLRFSEDARIGPGKIALLEAAMRSGSLAQAGAELNMSERRVALLLDALNDAFDTPVIELDRNPVVVTGFGRQLVQAYRAVERETRAAVDVHFPAIAQRLR